MLQRQLLRGSLFLFKRQLLLQRRFFFTQAADFFVRFHTGSFTLLRQLGGTHALQAAFFFQLGEAQGFCFTLFFNLGDTQRFRLAFLFELGHALCFRFTLGFHLGDAFGFCSALRFNLGDTQRFRLAFFFQLGHALCFRFTLGFKLRNTFCLCYTLGFDLCQFGSLLRLTRGIQLGDTLRFGLTLRLQLCHAGGSCYTLLLQICKAFCFSLTFVFHLRQLLCFCFAQSFDFGEAFCLGRARGDSVVQARFKLRLFFGQLRVGLGRHFHGHFYRHGRLCFFSGQCQFQLFCLTGLCCQLRFQLAGAAQGFFGTGAFHLLRLQAFSQFLVRGFRIRQLLAQRGTRRFGRPQLFFERTDFRIPLALRRFKRRHDGAAFGDSRIQLAAQNTALAFQRGDAGVEFSLCLAQGFGQLAGFRFACGHQLVHIGLFFGKLFGLLFCKARIISQFSRGGSFCHRRSSSDNSGFFSRFLRRHFFKHRLFQRGDLLLKVFRLDQHRLLTAAGFLHLLLCGLGGFGGQRGDFLFLARHIALQLGGLDFFHLARAHAHVFSHDRMTGHRHGGEQFTLLRHIHCFGRGHFCQRGGIHIDSRRCDSRWRRRGGGRQNRFALMRARFGQRQGYGCGVVRFFFAGRGGFCGGFFIVPDNVAFGILPKGGCGLFLPRCLGAQSLEKVCKRCCRFFGAGRFFSGGGFGFCLGCCGHFGGRQLYLLLRARKNGGAGDKLFILLVEFVDGEAHVNRRGRDAQRFAAAESIIERIVFTDLQNQRARRRCLPAECARGEVFEGQGDFVFFARFEQVVIELDTEGAEAFRTARECQRAGLVELAHHGAIRRAAAVHRADFPLLFRLQNAEHLNRGGLRCLYRCRGQKHRSSKGNTRQGKKA